MAIEGSFVHIGDIIAGKYDGQKVSIRGWVYRERGTNKLRFIIVRDATGIIQSVIDISKVGEESFAKAKKLQIEASVKLHGLVTVDARAPGGHELQADAIEIVGISEQFPITEYQSEEFLLDNRHLWIRSRHLTTVMRVKSALLRSAREWFDKNEFFEVTPPIITMNACEGGSTLFNLNYFGEKAYLSQSAQMYLEALIFSLERVWSLTPSFRAEKSRTLRHLAEYWHLEEEAAWVDNNENIKIQEELVSHMVQSVLKNCKEELTFLGQDLEKLKKVEPPFKRITYYDAVKILQNKGFEFKFGDDFGTNEERAITQEEEKPVFVMNFPKDLKAFYMKENPDDPKTVLCADLLPPGGYPELIGGSERETDVAKLVARLQKENIPLANYEWYLDLRRFGSVPHSGFGLGIERFLFWICKLEHIRDSIPFPRVLNRAKP